MQYTKITMSNVSASPRWRPWALYTKSLSGFICLCLLLLIITVAVTLRCAAAGSCRIFGKSSSGSIPPQSAFVYHQLPTVLGVILGFIWIVPHHHILRLEPYFRMSDGKGEKAKNSLFLQYPYETLVLVPFKALLRGHYVVGLSSITLLLINFLIVPSSSRAFDMVVFTDSQLGTAKRGFPRMNDHNVSADITFSAYNRAWRNGSLLPFMTDEYALLPLSPDGYSFALGEVWTAETTLFEAELECVDAQPPVFGYVNNSLEVDIISIDGVNKVHFCDAGALGQKRISQTSDCNDYTAFITPFTSMFWEIGNTANPPVSYMYGWASGPPSPPNITANSTFPKPTDITAIFCVPSYYTETVNATINMPSGTVVGVARSGIRTKIPTLGGFDGILDANPEVSFADELLVQGVPVRHKVPVRFGFPPETVASVETDLLERFGMSSRPIVSENLGRTTKSNLFMTRTNHLSAFSLFRSQNNTLESLLDSRELQRMHERGLKMLFAFAAASMMGGNSDNMTLVDAERKVPTLRITVNRAWALVVALALCVVIVLTTLLTFLIKYRTLNLNSEPESMAASLKILSVSPGLCDAMKGKEYCEPEKLCEEMNGAALTLKLVMRGEHPVIEVEGMEVDVKKRESGTDIESDTGVGAGISIVTSTEDDAIKSETRADAVGDTGVEEKEEGGKKLPKRKWEFGYLLRVVYIACFPIVTALLIFIFAFSRSKDGFPTPGGPTGFVSKIVFGFFPTVVGSIFGSILMSLGATYCMMRPYITLRARNARYSKSLATDYDSSPPQFRVINPLQNNHYTLATLSIAILLSQALSATIGSLFTPPTIYSPRVERQHRIYQNFSSTRQEMYFEMYKSLTTNNYPTWTTKEFYIDPPFEIAPNVNVTYDTFGFGVNVTCNTVPRDIVTFPCSPQYSNITDPTCTSLKSKIGSPKDNIISIENYCSSLGYSALFWNGTCSDSAIFMSKCPDRMLPVWVENRKFDITPPGLTDSYRFTTLNCSVEDRIVSLRATVEKGKVVSTTNEYPLDKDQVVSRYSENMTTSTLLSISFIKALQKSIADEQILTGNHQLTRINYLVATVNSSVVQEPRNETHIPDERVLADAFETVIQGLFVNLLRMSAGRVFGAGVERTEYTETYRVYVDTVNFAIAMAIMVFFCGVVVALCFGQRQHHIPHLPYSLAGAYLHLYGSDAIQDVWDETKMSEEKYYLKKHEGGYHGVYKEEKVVELSESMGQKKG